MQRPTFTLLTVLVMTLLAIPAMAEETKTLKNPPQNGVQTKAEATKSDVDLYNAARWRALDPAKKGKITYAEYVKHGFAFKNTLAPEQQKQVEQYVRQAFELYDTNGNDAVTLAEYNAYHEKRFKQIDTDGNNILSQAEVQADEERVKAESAKKK